MTLVIAVSPSYDKPINALRGKDKNGQAEKKALKHLSND
jgi:hypothetical protein